MISLKLTNSNMLKFFKTVYLLLIVVSLVPVLVFAETNSTINPTEQAKQKMNEIKNEAKKLNQLPGSITSPQEIIGLAIKILTMFMGAIMFLLIVYGGVLWMTASGNSEQITKAKNIIIWAALGVAVMLASYIVVNFVFTSLETSV